MEMPTRGVPTREVGDGFASVCPLPGCGCENKAPWDESGRIVWWPKAGDCPHYRGVYEGGRTPLALYR